MQNLILIGYRGTGKSAVAKRLAARLGWPWVDSDQEVEREAGRSIRAIFDDSGEEAFRDLESSVLARLARQTHIVIAAGGGAVLREENRRILRQSGKLVWLQAPPETILQRIAADPATAGQRPNLTQAGGLEEIRELLTGRTPIYRECADLAVDTHGKSPDAVAEEIVVQLDLPSSLPE